MVDRLQAAFDGGEGLPVDSGGMKYTFIDFAEFSARLYILFRKHDPESC